MMKSVTLMRRRLIAATVGLLSLVCLAGVAIAMRGGAACSLVDVMNLDTMDHGLRVAPDATPAERQAYASLYLQARERIRLTFGAPISAPIVIFLKEPAAYFPLSSNSYGSTHFIGSRSCAVLGPEGMNVDVTAHELVHAEAFHRMGYWARLVELPVWFDEGLGMQVDHRPEFIPDPSTPPEDLARVTELKSAAAFFTSEPATLRQNYKRSKGHVALWVKAVGAENVYARLERLRQGESFDRATTP